MQDNMNHIVDERPYYHYAPDHEIDSLRLRAIG